MHDRQRTLLYAIIAALCLLCSTAGSTHAAAPEYRIALDRYAPPDVTLINQDGKKIRLAALVSSGKPVVVDFIYGTCTTICPVLSAGFANFQRKLGADARSVQLVSISIDPEHDSPAVMKKYLKQYGAQPGWDFLTGSRADIDRVMHSFDAYIPNKMSHYPILFLKAPDKEQWVRIQGLIGTSDFMNEYKKAVRK